MERRAPVISSCLGIYRSGEAFYSIDEQLKSLKREAENNGFRSPQFMDVARQSWTRLDDLTKELTQANVKFLILWRLDCLGPLAGDLESVIRFLAQLSKNGISFVSIKDNIDSSWPVGAAFSTFYDAWIGLKRNRKTENARLSSIKAKANGNKNGPPRRRDDRKIFQLRSGGLSIRQIARETGFSAALIHQVLKKKGDGTRGGPAAVTDLRPESGQ